MGLVFFAHDNSQGAAIQAIAPAPAATPIPTDEISASAPAQPAASVATPEAARSAVFIPTVGVHAPIIETYLDGASWDVTHLGTNAGHLQGTAWFDQPGNVVLAGHVEMADGRRGVFARIGEVSVGDPIIVQQGDDERHYVVRAVQTTTPDDLSVLYPTPDDQLTLITCDAYDFFQDAYLERTVVVAERIA